MASPYNYRFNPWRNVGLTRVALPTARWIASESWGTLARAGRALAGRRDSAPRVLLAAHCDLFDGFSDTVRNDRGFPLGHCSACQRWRVMNDNSLCCNLQPKELKLDDLRAATYRLISRTPHLTWLMCIHDPVAALKRFRVQATHNLWAGLVVSDRQSYASKIYPFISLDVPVRFLYVYRPTDAVRLERADISQIDWVVCRWELNDTAADMNIARTLRDQCEAANIPFYFSGPHGKDLDGKEYTEAPPDNYFRRRQ